jgi:lactoylglutathione lyase
MSQLNRRRFMQVSATAAAVAVSALPALSAAADDKPAPQPPGEKLDLGNFSVSLAVKDIETSKQFYMKLGFMPVAGNQAKHWLVMKSGSHKIGLFQGMFDKNILTFNPGWDSSGQPLKEYTDVRVLQREFKKRGLTLATEADEKTTGPASLTVVDPDGNTILLDQFV